MKDIQECGNCVAGRLANVGLLHQSFVEDGDGCLLFICIAASLLTFNLLARGGTGNVEPHFNELIFSSIGLLALCLTVGFSILIYGELDCYFVATGKVGVGDLRVRNFERWSILNVEGKFGLSKIRLAPVPAAQRVLLVLKVMAVPVLEDLVQTLIVLQSLD